MEFKTKVVVYDERILVYVTSGWKDWLVSNFKDIPGYWFHHDEYPKYWSFPTQQKYLVIDALRYVSEVEWIEDGKTTLFRRGGKYGNKNGIDHKESPILKS